LFFVFFTFLSEVESLAHCFCLLSLEKQRSAAIKLLVPTSARTRASEREHKTSADVQTCGIRLISNDAKRDRVFVTRGHFTHVCCPRKKNVVDSVVAQGCRGQQACQADGRALYVKRRIATDRTCPDKVATRIDLHNQTEVKLALDDFLRQVQIMERLPPPPSSLLRFDRDHRSQRTCSSSR